MTDRPASRSARRAGQKSPGHGPGDKPPPRSEEDLQPKDAGEMPIEPQDPVKPPDPAS